MAEFPQTRRTVYSYKTTTISTLPGGRKLTSPGRAGRSTNAYHTTNSDEHVLSRSRNMDEGTNDHVLRATMPQRLHYLPTAGYNPLSRLP